MSDTTQKPEVQAAAQNDPLGSLRGALGEEASAQTVVENKSTDPPAPVSVDDPVTPPADQPAAQQPAAEDKQPEQPAEPTSEAPASQPSWMDDALGESNTPLTVDDGVKAFFKDHLGADDVPAFLDAYRASQESNLRMKEELTQAQQLSKVVESLPPSFQTAIAKQLKGEDGLAFLNSLPKLDWGSDAKKQDQQELINAFYPGKVTQDDWDAAKDGDETAKDKIATYERMAADQFNGKRDDLIRQQREHEQAQEKFREKYNASVDQAVAYLKQQKGFGALATGELRQQLLSGELVNKTLFNDDGTYKPEAPLTILKGLHYDELMARKAEVIRKQAKEAATIDAMNRTPEQPRTKQGGGPSAGAAAAEQDPSVQALKQLLGEA